VSLLIAALSASRFLERAGAGERAARTIKKWPEAAQFEIEARQTRHFRLI